MLHHTDRLPFSIRALLENAVRNCDDTYITQNDVMTILNWKKNQSLEMEIPFKAARLILQDSTCVHISKCISLQEFPNLDTS